MPRGGAEQGSPCLYRGFEGRQEGDTARCSVGSNGRAHSTKENCWLARRFTRPPEVNIHHNYCECEQCRHLPELENALSAHVMVLL